MRRLWPWLLLVPVVLSCESTSPFDPTQPARGPGGMVGLDGPITDGRFPGGDDTLPAAREVAPPDGTRPPDCGPECVGYCERAGLQNPVNRGLCRSLWGVGLAHQPIVREEACRRLHVDMLGRIPTAEEMAQVCGAGWGEAVRRLMGEPDYLLTQQRRAADEFLYSTEVVSVERIYDMDRLVARLHRGEVPYDLYAAVVSAHPVLLRRYTDPGDMAEALFRHFLGRPPFDNERADLARLYRLWHRGYYDHPYLNMRLPDSFLRFRCLGEDGQVDPNARGECTSVLWGYEELIFTPDLRAARDAQLGELTLWSGLLRAEEWQRLQVPGRVLSRQRAFWERAVGQVLETYLGYDLGAQVPEVREELVDYLLRHNGDIRSVHYAVATSAAYLQSHGGPSTSRYRWTYGPLKQVQAEVWLDSLAGAAGYPVAGCDHRISHPEDFIESGSLSAWRLLNASRWSFDAEGELDLEYASLARTLGGCPRNVVGGRFRVVSILTTATQLGFVDELCNPTLDPQRPGAPIERLLPADVPPARALESDAQLALRIAEHQYRLLLGREASEAERAEATQAGQECAAVRCSAEEFARPLCFALLSSAEKLFQ